MEFFRWCLCCICKNMTRRYGYKPATIANSTKCAGCGINYHNDNCLKLAKRRSNGIFNYCCKNSRNANTSNIDPTLKPLWALIESKLNSSLDTIDGRFNELETKLENKIELLAKSTSILEDKCDLIDNRINSIEDNIGSLSQTTISEVKEMIQREKNIILFEFEDSINAAKEDLIKVKDIFTNSSVTVPFDINSIKTQRLGKKFIQGKHRLLRVMFRSSEHTSWVFHNKKKLFNGNIKVNGDLTKNQQAYYKSIKSELMSRINSGEENLYIAYRNRVPYIAKKFNTNSK